MSPIAPKLEQTDGSTQSSAFLWPEYNDFSLLAMRCPSVRQFPDSRDFPAIYKGKPIVFAPVIDQSPGKSPASSPFLPI